jgi:hypothetical protein
MATTAALTEKPFSCTREQVRSRLEIPSLYFLSRGYSANVLDALNVGHSPKLKKSIVPVFDDAGLVCVGFLMRSEKPFCKECRRHHQPSSDCRYGQARWGIQRGFRKQQFLYNLAHAMKSDKPFVLLVEGPGDVFRSVEAGFPAVALLGTDMADGQVEKLAKLNKKVVIAFDNDKAGKENSPKIHARLATRGIEVEVLHPPQAFKDMGEMPTKDVIAWLGTLNESGRLATIPSS